MNSNPHNCVIQMTQIDLRPNRTEIDHPEGELNTAVLNKLRSEEPRRGTEHK